MPPNKKIKKDAKPTCLNFNSALLIKIFLKILSQKNTPVFAGFF